MKETNRVTSSDGTSIAFDRTGSGPALVMVDAAGCFRGFGPMRALAELLASDFTVITYDRRGRGDSTDTLPYTVDREVDDLHALIQVAGGPVFVYGFSSGAVLALHAALCGLSISKLALLEPPLDLQDKPPVESDLGAEIAQLVSTGRRGDAAEHFQRSIGVPAELIEGQRQSAAWPAIEALAHTLVYDIEIAGSFPTARLASITTPTLVVASGGSDDRLRTWAHGLCDTLPNATLRMLKGEWHGVPAQDLAPVLSAFLIGH